MKTITTIGMIDPAETKSGYRINEYYISLSDEAVQRFRGKKVEIKGTLLVVEAIDPNAVIKTQGAEGDRLFIVNPEIKIVE